MELLYTEKRGKMKNKKKINVYKYPEIKKNGSNNKQLRNST